MATPGVLVRTDPDVLYRQARELIEISKSLGFDPPAELIGKDGLPNLAGMVRWKMRLADEDRVWPMNMRYRAYGQGLRDGLLQSGMVDLNWAKWHLQTDREQFPLIECYERHFDYPGESPELPSSIKFLIKSLRGD